MNIVDTVKQNLIDLSAFLHNTATLDVSQLGSEWEARKILVERHATFIDTFTIPDLGQGPAPGFTPAQYVPRPADLEVKGDESSASVPFIPARIDRP